MLQIYMSTSLKPIITNDLEAHKSQSQETNLCLMIDRS